MPTSRRRALVALAVPVVLLVASCVDDDGAGVRDVPTGSDAGDRADTGAAGR